MLTLSINTRPSPWLPAVFGLCVSVASACYSDPPADRDSSEQEAVAGEVGMWIAQLQHPSAEARGEAAVGLRRIGPPAASAVPHLVALLRDGSALEWRSSYGGVNPTPTSPAREASLALAAIGEAAVESLAAILRDSICGRGCEGPRRTQNMYVKAALEGIGSPAVSHLIDVVETGARSPSLQAMQTLGRIGAEAAVATHALLSAAQDDDPVTRKIALSALADVGAPQNSLTQLVAVAEQDPDPEVRSAAILAIATLGDQALPAMHVLVDGVVDADRFVAGNSIDALAAIGPAAGSATSALRSVLESMDATEANKRRALYAVAQIGVRSEAESIIGGFLEHERLGSAARKAWSDLAARIGRTPGA